MYSKSGHKRGADLWDAMMLARSIALDAPRPSQGFNIHQLATSLAGAVVDPELQAYRPQLALQQFTRIYEGYAIGLHLSAYYHLFTSL